MDKLVEYLKSEKTVIVDVRTPGEFSGGHVTGSINIPLSELPHRIADFENMENIVLCCQSGGRSEQATQYLRHKGLNCINGGPWTTVNYYKNN